MKPAFPGNLSLEGVSLHLEFGRFSFDEVSFLYCPKVGFPLLCGFPDFAQISVVPLHHQKKKHKKNTTPPKKTLITVNVFYSNKEFLSLINIVFALLSVA